MKRSLFYRYIQSRMIRSISVIVLSVFLVGVATGQSNYVLKTGDTMTGTLSIKAANPEIDLLGPDTGYKYIFFATTNNTETFWVISQDPSGSGNRMSFYCSPDGSGVMDPVFYISTNGVLHGNAAGLTNLNVALAIPNGSISGDKLETQYLTSEVYTNGTMPFLSVGGQFIGGGHPQAVGNNSMAVGLFNTASNSSFAAGNSSVASGVNSFAAGQSVQALGSYSHAEGSGTEAVGDWSHAEGWSSTASGGVAHAEGWLTDASGSSSHAEGDRTVAAGNVSHADGYLSEAQGTVSFASGWSAKALHDETYVWSSNNASNDMDFASTTNKQFNVYAHNGIRLLTGPNGTVEIGGKIIGDGSGLTNLNITSTIPSGSITMDKLSTNVMDQIRNSASQYYYSQSVTDGTISFDPVMSREKLTQWSGSISNGYWMDNAGGVPAKLVQSSCMTLDGVDDVVEFPVSTPASQLKTIACWVKFNSLSIGAGREIISKSAHSKGVELLLYNGNLSYFVMGVSADQHIDYPVSNFTVGQWYHIAGVNDGPNSSMALYVDGVAVGSTNAPSAIDDSSADLMVGNWNDSSGRYLDGSIADVRVFRTALTENEIQAVMAGDKVSLDSMELWAPMAEGDGLVAYDVSGNGHHGTVSIGADADDSLLWSQRQDVFHYNITRGFSRDYYNLSPATGSYNKYANQTVSNSTWTNFHYECDVFLDGSDTWGEFFKFPGGSGYKNGARLLYAYGNTISLEGGNGSSVNYSVPISGIKPYKWYHLIANYDGTTATLSVNGVSNTKTVPFSFNSTALYGGYRWSGSGQPLDGFTLVRNSKLWLNGSLYLWHTLEGNDGGVDLSGNGHDIAWNSSYYTQRTDFFEDESTRVPALADQSGRDALGFPVSNPAGNGLNGAETEIVQASNNTSLKLADEGLNFWYDTNGVAKLVGYSDLLNLDSNRIITDTSDPGIIKSVRTFNTDLTGDELAKAQSFTDTKKVDLNGLIAANSTLDMKGNRIANLGDATLDTDAASQGHVKAMLQQVPGYGDIPMGSFTSQVAMPDRPTGPGLVVSSGEIAQGAVSSDALGDNSVTTTKLADGAVTADKIATNSISADKFVPNIGIVPSGAIMAWPVQQLPEGWLECNGQELSISSNAALYAVIGAKYGGDVAQDKFNLPDYRGYFLRGYDNGAGRDPDASSRTGGNVVGSTQKDKLADHTHPVGQFNSSGNNDAYFITKGWSGSYSSRYIPGDGSTLSTTTITGLNDDTRDIVTGSAIKTSSPTEETRPKNINVMWIIKK